MSRANEKGHRYIFLNVTEKYNRQLQTFDEMSWVFSKHVTGNYDHSARISMKQPKAQDKKMSSKTAMGFCFARGKVCDFYDDDFSYGEMYGIFFTGMTKILTNIIWEQHFYGYLSVSKVL